MFFLMGKRDEECCTARKFRHGIQTGVTKEKEIKELAHKRKKHQLEKVAIIVSIINGIVTAICMIYETFFK